jgi:hypothetical protein
LLGALVGVALDGVVQPQPGEFVDDIDDDEGAYDDHDEFDHDASRAASRIIRIRFAVAASP